MTCEELLNTISKQCDELRSVVLIAAGQLNFFDKRLRQILQQLFKNIEVRDTEFAPEFNAYCHHLREQINEQEPIWAALRTNIRGHKSSEWDGAFSLAAKGLNRRAKALSRACDEFTTAYDTFCKQYKNYTAAKLNVWLLTSCQTDIANLTGKILFLAREIARKTENNRGPHANR
jgi:hypothetical protein